MKWFCFVVVLINLIGARLVLAAQSPVGKWKTLDENSGNVTSEVEIYEQSGKLFGKIVALRAERPTGQTQSLHRVHGNGQRQAHPGASSLRDFSLAEIVTRAPS